MTRNSFTSIVALLLFCFSIPSTGCSRKTSVETDVSEVTETIDTEQQSTAGVATIDVNRIASESGALAVINRELDNKEKEFNLILDGLRKIHLNDLVKLEKEHGDNPTEEQKQAVLELRQRQSTEYNVKWQDTRIKLSAIKQKLDESFLSKVRPLAQKVAEEKGLSVVIRNENVFCLVDQYDITSAVAEKYKTNFPAEELAEPVAEVAEIKSRGGGFVPR